MRIFPLHSYFSYSYHAAFTRYIVSLFEGKIKGQKEKVSRLTTDFVRRLLSDFRMMFARTFALAATLAALVMSTVAACRNITFTIYLDSGGMTRSTLEINSLYFGNTGWSFADNDPSCSGDRRYCYRYNSEGVLLLAIAGKEYTFVKPNRRPNALIYEYWHCVDA